MKIVRYGILGPGRIAASYAKALLRTENSQIVAVGSRDTERAKAFAKQFDIAKTYDSYELLARDPNVDVIYIATPHSFHEAQALLCMGHKKAVVSEKPLTLTAASARKLVERARAHQVFLMEGMWSRFNPAIIKAKQLVDDGAIGDVKHLSADFGFQKAYDPATRLYDLALGGGATLDVGVYPLFFALFVLGRPKSISVSAQLAPTGADESCSASLTFDGGAIAQLYSSMVVETKKEALISGTNGLITIHSPWYKSMGLTLYRKGMEEHFPLPYEGNGFEFQIEETNRCLLQGLKESDKMSHDFSIMKAEVSDEILKKAGVRYKA